MTDIKTEPQIKASDYRGAQSLEDYVRAEVEKISDIYSRRFPDRHIRMFIYLSENPVWGNPQILHHVDMVQPHHMTADCLGMVRIESASGDAPEMTVRVSIPRRPTPLEDKGDTEVWAPSGRALRSLYRASPMLYERLRFLHERRQEKRSSNHSWSSLPAPGFSSLFAQPVQQSDKTPAILIGMHWLEHGGAEKLGFDCIHWAREMGLRVIVVSDHAAFHRMADRLPEDVRFIRLDRYLPQGEWAIYLENLIREENVRIIHIHHCVALYSVLAHLRAVTPWVEVIDSTHIVEYADGGFPRISGVWSNFITLHHVISRQLGTMLRQRFATGNKVALGRMLDEGREAALPERFNLDPATGKLSVAFVGRLYYQKRPLTVVLAMKALADWAKTANVAIRFDFVGEGPFAPAAEALMRRLGIADLVTRHPASADVRAILSRSDIMLLPSSNEGLALVCYEAIEQGAIPISTDVGAQSEIVPADLLVPRNPAEAVRGTLAAVQKLWTDEKFRNAQIEALRASYLALAADPTAERVVKDFYSRAAVKLD